MTKTVMVHAQQRWEYMEVTRKTEGYLIGELNALGDEGWDAVSVHYYKAAKSGLGDSWCWTAFLKRPHVGNTPAGSSIVRGAGSSAGGPPAQRPARLEPSKPRQDDLADDEIAFADSPKGSTRAAQATAPD